MNVDEDELLDRVRGLVAGLMPPGTVVGPDTGLREHGLESLAVTRLWFLLRKEFGVDIPVPWLGAGPTVAALADRVRAEQRPGQPTAEPATPPATDRFAAFPLTDLQQAYLIGRDPQLGGDPVGCLVYREFEVPQLDVDRLYAAWYLIALRGLRRERNAVRSAAGVTSPARCLGSAGRPPGLAGPGSPCPARGDPCPDTFTFGNTIVAGFQIGRVFGVAPPTSGSPPRKTVARRGRTGRCPG